MTTRRPDPPAAYVGRFAPSPSGPLHRGSLVAALASWLDARAHDGRWLLRIEDIDRPREKAGAAGQIVAQLRALGLAHDGTIERQSDHERRYAAAFDHLRRAGRIYGCACTRAERIRLGDVPYPGTCRQGLPPGRSPRAWRVRLDDDPVDFVDRWHGPQRQWPARTPGDPIVQRADGPWAYVLAVVVDDAAAGVTDVVRGEDLLADTGRQIALQRLLGLPTPRYLHVPLVRAADGRKLSKSDGDAAIVTDEPARGLQAAAAALDLPTDDLAAMTAPAPYAARFVAPWRRRFG